MASKSAITQNCDQDNIQDLARARQAREKNRQKLMSSPPSTKLPDAMSPNTGHLHRGGCSYGLAMQVNGNVDSDKGMANQYIDQQAQDQSKQVNGNISLEAFRSTVVKA